MKLEDWYQDVPRSRIETFQLYFLLVQQYGVHHGKRKALFEMLVSRRVHRQKSDDYYLLRKDMKAVREVKQFTETWKHFLDLAELCGYESPFLEETAWLLFSFFLQKESQITQGYIELFKKLSQDHQIQLNFPFILQFCKENPLLHANAIRLLEEAYEIFKEKFPEQRWRRLAAKLFLDPPINIKLYKQPLEWARAKIDFFHKQVMQRFGFRVDVHSVEFLRYLILNQGCWAIKLALDHVTLGIERVDPSLLFSYLQTVHEGIDVEIQPLHRQKAQQIVYSLFQKWTFSDLQKLRLYRDIVKLLAKGKEDRVRQIFSVIVEMEKMSLGVPLEVICHLYQCCLEVFLDKFHELKEQRDKYLQSSLGRLVVHPDMYVQTAGFLELCKMRILGQCPKRKQSKELEKALGGMLETLFFPPFSHLRMFMNVSAFDRRGEAIWSAAELAPLTGKCAPIIPNAKELLFVSWDVIAQKPCLNFSCMDLFTGEVRTHPVVLNISLEEVKADIPDQSQDIREKRANLLAFFYQLATLLLKEEPDQGHKWKEELNTFGRLDGFSGLGHCHVGFKELLIEAKEQLHLSKKQVDAFLEFLEEVKISFRRLYFKELLADYSLTGSPKHVMLGL